MGRSPARVALLGSPDQVAVATCPDVYWFGCLASKGWPDSRLVHRVRRRMLLCRKPHPRKVRSPLQICTGSADTAFRCRRFAPLLPYVRIADSRWHFYVWVYRRPSGPLNGRRHFKAGVKQGLVNHTNVQESRNLFSRSFLRDFRRASICSPSLEGAVSLCSRGNIVGLVKEEELLPVQTIQ